MPVAPDRLARYFFHGVSELDLARRRPEDLAGAALAQLELGRTRRSGRSLVRVFNPDPARDGFSSSHTAIMVVTSAGEPSSTARVRRLRTMTSALRRDRSAHCRNGPTAGGAGAGAARLGGAPAWGSGCASGSGIVGRAIVGSARSR